VEDDDFGLSEDEREIRRARLKVVEGRAAMTAPIADVSTLRAESGASASNIGVGMAEAGLR
jgi:hypothetical protein